MHSGEYLIDKTLKIIWRYLRSPDNIITNISTIDCYNDYPKLYHYASQYSSVKGNDNIDLIANGISLNKKDAFVKTVMETVERWYLANYSRVRFIKDTFVHMSGRGLKPIHPDSFSPFSSEQIKKKRYSQFRVNDTTQFLWTDVKSFFDNQKVYIPAQLIYLMPNGLNKEPIIRFADTVGTSAGTSIAQVLYRAMCELLERDAFAIVYYNKLPVKKISIKHISDNNIQDLISYLSKYLLDVNIFDLRLDIEIPIFLCVMVNQTDIGPKITVGVKADLSWRNALFGAILESLQTVTTLRDILTLKKTFSTKSFQKILVLNRPILKRLLYWARPQSITELDFILNQAQTIINYDDKYESKTFLQKLSLVTNLLKKNKFSIYWKLIAPDILSKFHIYVAKVLIPELVALSMIGEYPYLGGDRLYDIPKKMGFKLVDINKVIHPLP